MLHTGEKRRRYVCQRCLLRQCYDSTYGMQAGYAVPPLLLPLLLSASHTLERLNREYIETCQRQHTPSHPSRHAMPCYISYSATQRCRDAGPITLAWLSWQCMAKGTVPRLGGGRGLVAGLWEGWGREAGWGLGRPPPVGMVPPGAGTVGRRHLLETQVNGTRINHSTQRIYRREAMPPG